MYCECIVNVLKYSIIINLYTDTNQQTESVVLYHIKTTFEIVPK